MSIIHDYDFACAHRSLLARLAAIFRRYRQHRSDRRTITELARLPPALKQDLGVQRDARLHAAKRKRYTKE